MAKTDKTDAERISELKAQVSELKGQLDKKAKKQKYSITQLKQRSIDLKILSSEREIIFRIIPDTLITIDARTNMIESSNSIATEMFGYSASEFSNLDIQSLSAEPDKTNIVLEKFAQQGKERMTLERLMVRKNGSTFPTEVSATNYWISGERKIMTVIRDVTERKKIENALRQNEFKFRQFFERESGYCYMISPEGLITDVNQTALDALGYLKEELLEKPLLTTVYAPSSRDKAKKLFGKWKEKGFLNDEELFIITKSGEERLVRLSVGAIYDESGNIVSSVSTQNDITEMDRLRQQAMQSQKMDSIGALAGGIAHDFNNVLQPILGYADLLKDRFPEDSEEYRFAEIISNAANRAKSLTQGILGFARRGRIKEAVVDVHETIRNNIELLGRIIDKRIVLSQRLNPDARYVKGDPSQVEQIVMNLAVNAKESMAQGGSILFETEKVYLDEKFCQVRHIESPGDYILMSVSDTGTGMPSEIIERIFEPYFSTKNEYSESGRGPGTGLGLATVYGIVKNHKGFVDVESKVGEGTKFRVYLPLEEKVDHVGPKKDKFGCVYGEGTILAIDDEEFIRRLYDDALTPLGYTVFLAKDGVEGIKMHADKKDEIDLIILDMTMPFMDGSDCFAELYKQDPNVKVLIASGNAESDTTNELLAKGVKGYVAKPMNILKLSEVVANVMKG